MNRGEEKMTDSIIEEIQKREDINGKLSFMYENIDETNMKDCCDILQTLEFKNFVSFVKRKKLEGGTFSDKDYISIALLVDILQVIYNYSGFDTGINDQDYDVLYEVLEDKNLDFVSVAIKSRKKIVHHKYTRLRGTLEKIFAIDNEKANKSRKSLEQWVAKKEKYLRDNGTPYNLMEHEVYIFPKWNGISVIHEFDENNHLIRSLTRGFTELNEAEDVTEIFKPIEDKIKTKAVDIKGIPYGLKTEVIIEDKVFKKYNKDNKTDFKSARSLCNSIILGEPDDRVNLLTIKKLRYSTIDKDGNESLEKNCPEVFESNYAILMKLIDKEMIHKYAVEYHNAEGCDCDGVVIQFIEDDLKQALGRDGDKNRFEVAYKYNEEVAYTKIKDIKFQIGPLGTMTPVAVFQPVKMKGNKITNASLGSYQRFLDLELAKGDTVKILYEIIPYLVYDEDDPNCERSGNKMITAPKNCPECGEEFDISDTSPRCLNPDCPCKQKGKILNYVRKMRIEGIDYQTISSLYEVGILSSIKDLYSLKKKKDLVVELPGFGKKSYDIIISEIDARKEVYGSVLLGSLGIVGASKLTFKSLLNTFSIEEIMEFAENNQVEAFTCLKGVKEKKAERIINGLLENRSLIKFLEKELTIIPESKTQVRFITCFHGIRSIDVLNLIEKKHGMIKDTLTKDVDFLISENGDDGSSKVEKAKKYGIEIVSLKDAKDYIKENYR